MQKVLSTVACNLDVDILGACLPLLEAERIEAIEWSFDTLYDHQQIPEWFHALLTAFSNEQRLIGHGVFFSLFSGKWLPEQQRWLHHLKRTCDTFRFDHITEHFGFMTGKDFHNGAPLNIPYNTATLRIGRDRLQRIYDACRCPVGLENLAFSYSLEEVKKHGRFLEELLEPVNGFIILDLHNLYCQIHNFDITFEEIIALYPLHRVREIHISGGSWDDSMVKPDKKVRRDTHDDSVPEEVFQLLQHTIPLCTNLQYVVMEQLGNGLQTEARKQVYRDDFLRMQKIVHLAESPRPSNNFMPAIFSLPDVPAQDSTLYLQQQELSYILESAPTYEAAILALQGSSLAHSDWRVESWEPYMIETAINIAQKWKHGW